MLFHPDTLQRLSQDCHNLTSPCTQLNESIALATGWTRNGSMWMKEQYLVSDLLGPWFTNSTDPPPFTHLLDGVKLLIAQLGPYSHYGTIRKLTGEYRSYITVHYENLTPKDRMYSGTHESSDILSLCEAALVGLADISADTV